MVERILLLIPDLHTGGARSAILALGQALGVRHEVRLVALGEADITESPGISDIRAFDLPRSRGWRDRARLWRRRLRLIADVKNDWRASVNISFLEGANYVNAVSGGAGQVVLSVRGSKLLDPEMQGLFGSIRRRLLIPVLYRRAAAVVAPSAGLVVELSQQLGLPPQRLHSVPNGIDRAALQRSADRSLPRPWRHLEQETFLVYVARLHWGKGHLALLQVFAELRRVHPRLKLVLVGDGVCRTAIQERGTALGMKVVGPTAAPSLDDEVYITGFQDHPEAFVRAGRIFVFPSEAEGFGMALLEAMACGACIVSADAPWGPRELLAPELSPSGPRISTPYHSAAGVLLPPIRGEAGPSVHHWISTITNLLGDPTQRAGLADGARARAGAFSLATIAAGWEEVLQGVSGRASPA